VLLDADLRAERFESVRQLARKILAEHPSEDLRARIYSSVFRSYMEEKNYRAAADHARRLARERGDHQDRYQYDQWRNQALEAAGDLEGIVTLAREMQADYPGLLKAAADESLEERYARGLARTELRLATVYMARGRHAEAKRALEKYIAAPSMQQYRSGAELLLDFVERFSGKIRRADPEILSGTESRVYLNSSAEHVVLLLLIPRPDRSLATRLLEAVRGLMAERAQQGLTVLLLSPRDPGGDEVEDARQLQAIRDTTRTLGLSLPWGLASRADIERLFPSDRNYWCVMLDRQGRFTWVTSLACGPRPPRWTMAVGVLDELLGQPRSRER
jgi:tetratricopeptide (TPR) repeat protein